MKEKNIFLHASEHSFLLSFSEILMLRNYARSKKFSYCSQIGGSESIRDIQEAKNIDADSFEFKIVESLFSISKIIQALQKTYSDCLEELSSKYIFINISNQESLNLVKNLKTFKLPDSLKDLKIIINYDRRALIKYFYKLKNNNFEVYEYSEEIDKRITKFLKENQNRNFKVAISGGIDLKEINKNQEKFRRFDFIKTGLFTLKVDKEIDIINKIREKQLQEKQILQTMKEIIIQKNIYISARFSHLEKYIESFK